MMRADDEVLSMSGAVMSAAAGHAEPARSLTEMERLLEMTARLQGCHILEESLQEIAVAVAALVGADGGSVMLHDRDHLVVSATAGAAGPATIGSRIAREEGDGWQAMEEGRGIILGHDGSISDRLPAAGGRVIVALRDPVGHALGVASAYFSGPRSLSAYELELLELYARQAGGALARGLRIAETHRVLRANEESLRQHQMQLRAALMGGQMGTWSIDLRRREVRCSESTDLLFGVTPRGGGKIDDYMAYVHPEDAPVVVEALERALLEDTHAVEYRIIRPDGSIRWVASRGEVVDDQTGVPAMLTGALIDITERKNIEQRLRQGEDHLRNVLDAIGAFVGVMTPDGILREVNRAALDAAALTPEQVIGLPFEDGYWWSYSDLVRSELREMIGRAARGESVRYDVMIRLGENDFITVDFLIAPMRGVDGDVTHLVASAIDITERKKTEEALRGMHRNVSNILESIDDAFVVLDRNWRFVYVNRKAQAINGASVDMIGRSIWELFPALMEGDLYAHYQAAMAEQVRREFETCYAPIGTWYEVRLYPSKEGLSVYFRDITERRRTQQALRDSEDRLRLAMESAELGMWDYDPVAGPLNWSDHCKRIFGLPVTTDVDYPTFLARVSPDDRERITQDVDRALDADGSGEFQAEYRIIRLDGEQRWVSARGRAFFEERDGVRCAVRFIGTVLDITERMRAMEELEFAIQTTEQANRAKDEFLATLSHELRTPLTPVLAMVQFLEEEMTVPDEIRASLEMIRRNVELETRLIDDLLDLTRIARGKLRLSRQPVDLHALVGNVIEICQEDIRGKEMIVEIALRAANHTVDADPARFQQVIWNLIKNAVKFTPSGRKITIASHNDDRGNLALRVTDSGIGIEPEALARIFDAFEQGGAGIGKRFGGLGLGLAISRAIVDMHGGTLTAESRGRDCGATFTVGMATIGAAAAPESAGSPAADEKADGRLRILLVDDHHDSITVMRLLLERQGYRVITAGSVGAALDLAAGMQFDLLISDIGLPDGTGLDLIRALSATAPVRGIALSGFGMEEDLRRSREAGFHRHLTKPVNFGDLKAAIESLLAGEPPV